MVTHGTGKVASLVRTILSVPPAGPLPRKIDDIGLPLILKVTFTMPLESAQPV